MLNNNDKRVIKIVLVYSLLVLVTGFALSIYFAFMGGFK